MLKLSELSNLNISVSDLTKELSVHLKGVSGPNSAVPPLLLKKYLSKQGFAFTKKVISFINLKGGTGKTTSAVTTARRAVDYGINSCLLDIDAQASSSFLLAEEKMDNVTPFIELWDKPEEIQNAIIPINDSLSLLPSSLDNSLLDLQLSKPNHQKTAVKNCCEELFNNGNEIVFIDCPPSLGSGVISAICASDILVIPTTADSFAVRGIDLTIEEAGAISETFGLPKPDIFVLLTHYDRRVRICDEIFKLLKQKHNSLMINQPIRTSSAFARAQQQGLSIFDITKAKNVRSDYDYFVRTLLDLNNNHSGNIHYD